MGDITLTSSSGQTYTFDSASLESAAAKLKNTYADNPNELTEQLTGALIPDWAFGEVPNGADVASKLAAFVKQMREDATKNGVDVLSLAARVVAASQMVFQADSMTRRAARF